MRLLLIFTAVLVSSCTSSAYNVNGTKYEATNARLNEVRANWKNGSQNLSTTSSVPQDKTQWVLDLIALIETTPINSCTKLTLLKIKPEALREITTSDTNSTKRTYSPNTYNELWGLDVCGEIHQWRVFDVKESPDNKPTAILLAGRLSSEEWNKAEELRRSEEQSVSYALGFYEGARLLRDIAIDVSAYNEGMKSAAGGEKPLIPVAEMNKMAKAIRYIRIEDTYNVSYSLGFIKERQLKSNFDLKIPTFIDGLKTSTQKERPLLSEWEMQTDIKLLGEKIKQKREAEETTVKEK